MASRQIARTIPLALALTVLVAGARPVQAAASHVKKALTATSKAPRARGTASLLVRGSHGRLGVSGRRLPGGSTFEVIVDTVHVGTLSTNPAGNGKARFSTRPHGHDQLLGVDPSGKLIEVRDEDGDDVLETQMPDDPPPPGATRCCVADEDETECKQITPDACTTAGGTDMGAGSCMPNPCATTPPGDQIVCCQADHDEDGPECELSSAAECAEEGGTSLGVGTCDPNPCPATPPAAGEIACCVPESEGPDGDLEEQWHGEHGDDGDGEHGDGEHENECERTTVEGCTALGGVSMGAVSCCNPNPCETTTTSLPETTTTTTPGETTTTTTLM